MSLRSALRVARAPALGFGLLGAVWGAFAVQIPALKGTLGVGDALFGALLLCSGLGLVSAMWLAPVLERRRRGRALPLAYRVLGVCLPLPALAAWAGPAGPAAFGAAMAALGLASGLVDILMNAQVSALEQRHRRPLMNAAHGMFSLVYGGIALLAGVARALGAPPVLVFAALGAALGLLAYRASDPRAVTPRARADAPRAPLVPGAAVAACGVVVLLAFAAEAAVESWSALFLERDLGAGAAGGALGPALLGLTMAAGRFGGHMAAERLGEARMLLAGAGMACAGALGVATAPGLMAAYAGFAALGIGVAAVGPAGIAMAGRTVPRAHRTAAVAQATAMGFGGVFLAPVLMGAVSQSHGLRVAFALLGLAMLSVPLAAARARRGVIDA